MNENALTAFKKRYMKIQHENTQLNTRALQFNVKWYYESSDGRRVITLIENFTLLLFYVYFKVSFVNKNFLCFCFFAIFKTRRNMLLTL